MCIAGVFTVVLDVINKWPDLDCGAESLEPGKCQLCQAGPREKFKVAEIADICYNNPACVAFILDEVAPCAYLKTKATGQQCSVSLSKQYGSLGFCLNNRSANCSGECV